MSPAFFVCEMFLFTGDTFVWVLFVVACFAQWDQVLIHYAVVGVRPRHSKSRVFPYPLHMMDAARSGVDAFLFTELTFIIVFFHHLCGQFPPLMPLVKLI